MVKVATPLKAALSTCLFAAVASASSMSFINKCAYSIELYHSQEGLGLAKLADIAAGSTFSSDITGPAHMFRHGAGNNATLLEISLDSETWYDISIIPPSPGYCGSYQECKACTSAGCKTGFNVPVSVKPKQNSGTGTCTPLYCAADSATECSDAYLFPMDNTKTHHCPASTDFDVTFCYADSAASPTVTSTPAPSTTATLQGTVQGYADLGQVKAKYSYSGQKAGNVAGSYDRVTSLATCSKQSVSMQSPVGPMSEEVTMVFRGPMEINNIAVYSAEGGSANSTWSRVSSYSRSSGTTDNLVFMNNKNIDYSGKLSHGPQGYASADGSESAKKPTVFGGVLAEASNPGVVGGGPGVQTGAEVNIMTSKPCKGDCVGYAGDNDYHGWGGGKKAFVTQVKMPQGSTPNQPAIWMLNAQVVHSNQYGCNCRGMGSVGGCGELDIAEVIETNSARDKVSTHYYFYDGSVLSPGGDNFAARSESGTTVYVTLIDDSKDGLIKIVELADFDFTQTTLGSLYQQLVDC
ncbi:hypothetical protein BBJ28_00013969 [Nothophytophthora sp. Chile5]|nr:hypothetical protein BBJ28_00013969 [Nothophytophthora sp. Chile5]